MKYLYYATQNFRGFTENGFGDGIIDLKDMLILSYISFWESRREPDRVDNHIWIQRELMLSSLPFLGITSVDVLTRRFLKLENLGLMTRRYKRNKNGRERVYVMLTNLALSCLDGQEVALEQGVNCCDNQKKQLRTPPDSKVGGGTTLESGGVRLKSRCIIKKYKDKKYKDKKSEKTRFSVLHREMFEKVYKAYGVKADRVDSEFEFMRLKPNGDIFSKIIEGIEWDSEKTWGEVKYKPKLSSWLKKKVFQDIASQKEALMVIDDYDENAIRIANEELTERLVALQIKRGTHPDKVIR